MTAVTDEIFEKYLQKAIAETNELGDEIARAAGEAQVPVLGSGHPLAGGFLPKHDPKQGEGQEGGAGTRVGDVCVLKHDRKQAEVQEGVAFYGRAGQALLKSLQRLRVDPLALYGTERPQFAGGDEEEGRAWA